MNPITCLQKLKYVDTLVIATVDRENKPQVRVASAVRFTDNAIYFFATRGSDIARALKKNPHAQAMGLTRFNEMIRVSGPACKMRGEEAAQMKEQIFAESAALRELYAPAAREIGEVFAMEDLVIDYLNWGSRPIFRETYYVGDAKPRQDGYFITDDCIECGQCQYACPQRIIEEGTPYEIDQRHCMRCGSCFEACPTGAIVHLSERF